MLKFRKIVTLMAIFSLVAVYGLVPASKAASLTSAKDTLSDSDLGVAATSTIAFTSTIALGVNDYFEVTFPAAFGDVLPGNITCPTDTAAAAQTAEKIRCTATAPVGAGAKTIVLRNTTNPGTAGSYTINIASRLQSNALNEEANVMVAIIDNVDVSATVASTLTFEIRPLNNGVDVNGVTTTLTSATTSLAFGTLPTTGTTIMGQELHVTTNADYGYTVTVEQDGDLTSSAGSNINAFIEGVAAVSAVAWQVPVPVLDSPDTYGHMGLTSDDATLPADDFGASLFKGFDGTTPIPVLQHTGPADGTTDGKGTAKVAYSVAITPLQEAGDYTSVLTYIATPTY